MHANDVAKSTFGFRRLKKRRRPSGDPISTSGRRLRNRVSPDATTENDGVGRRNGDAIDDGRRKSGPRRRRRRRRRWHTRRNSAQATGHRFDSVARCRRRAGGGRRQVQVHVTPILGAPFSFAGLLLRHLLLLLLLRHRGRSHSSTPASRVSHRRRYRRRRDAPPRRYAADISHSIDRATKRKENSVSGNPVTRPVVFRSFFVVCRVLRRRRFLFIADDRVALMAAGPTRRPQQEKRKTAKNGPMAEELFVTAPAVGVVHHSSLAFGGSRSFFMLVPTVPSFAETR